MRHDKAAVLLQLARALAASAEGLTLDEMAREIGVGRRTAERMRDAVAALFPQLEENPDGLSKRFRIPGGLDGFFQSPTAEELAVLARAAEGFRAEGATGRAAALESLDRKVRSALKSAALRRVATDVEALVRAETLSVQAGPRPYEDPRTLGLIRHAITAMRTLRFRYEGGSTPGRRREVAPYGLMFGRTNYLVAAELGATEPKTWRLDRLAELSVTETMAPPPEDFDLDAFANRSFGVYQDAVEDVALKILPHGAEDARGWRFHPAQTLEETPDGSVIVRFRASGMLELAWHLFTWGDKVRVLAPERLRALLIEHCETALRAAKEDA